MNMMNKNFISRNRIYWMNRGEVGERRPIINEELFNISEEIMEIISDDNFGINIAYSNMPSAIGIMVRTNGTFKKYIAYGNDEFGELNWSEKFDKFECALCFAKSIYNYHNDVLGYLKGRAK